MPLGIYLSVPFCRTKCTFCNFASDVFSRAVFDRYLDRLCTDIKNAPKLAYEINGDFERAVDSIYLGGGTPTVLDAPQLERLFTAVRSNFDATAQAEITVECAPGTLTDAMLECLSTCGVNRVSLGVQSFVDQESAAVGRIHKRTTVLEDIARLRAAGIFNISIDLIAGLPHQTEESWEYSLTETVATGAPHISVYMLEVDENSRLGGELLAGGTRYHAHFVPDEGAVADFYLSACDRLQCAGIHQYEISNFARAGFRSRHNLKYWTRQPYLGFGVDAHSMLLSGATSLNALRFATPDSLERYMSGLAPSRITISHNGAMEESFFLGLRLTEGIDLQALATTFSVDALAQAHAAITTLVADGLMERSGDRIALTSRGRLFSNEVFEKFLVGGEISH